VGDRTDHRARRAARVDHEDPEPRRGCADVRHAGLRREIVGDVLGAAHAVVLPLKEQIEVPARVRIDGVFVELGDFRDFAVADGNGEIHAQWGKPPTPPPDQ
jgi:hypothetical protein